MKVKLIMLALLFCSTAFAQTPTISKDKEFDSYSNNNILTIDDMVFDELIAPLKTISLDTNSILIYDLDGVLKSLNLKTKTVNWSIKATDRDRNSSGNNKLFIENGVVYVPFINGEIFALNNQTGKLFWKTRLGIIKDAIVLKGQSPEIVNGSLVVSAQSRNQNIYSIDAKTGKLKWNYKLDYPYNHIPNLTFNGKVFAQNAPYLYSFDAKTGKALYKRGFKKAMYGKPVTDGKNIFIANESEMLFALKPDNLDILWEFNLEAGQYYIKEKIFTKANKIFFGTTSSELASVYSLNTSNGEKIWKTDIKGSIEYLVDKRNSIWGYTKTGLFFELDLATGKKNGEIQLTNIPLSNLEFLNQNELLFYSTQGLIKLNLNTKAEELVLKHTKMDNYDKSDAYIKLLKAAK